MLQRTVLLATLVLASAAFGQEQRGRVFGKVTDLRGKAWAGATVVLLSRPVPMFEWVGQADEITTKCDEKGRFDANLLPGRQYSVWAYAKKSATRYRFSKIVEDVIAGIPVRLLEREGEHPVLRLRLLNRDKWKAWEPLAFRVSTIGNPKNIVIHKLTFDENNEAELPPMPSSFGCTFEVLGKGKQPLYAKTFPLTSAGILARRKHEEKLRAHMAEPWPSSKNLPLEIVPIFLPSLTLTRIRAVSYENEAAIANARISIQADVFRQNPEEIAVTNGDGIADILLPLQWNKEGHLLSGGPALLLKAEGFGDSYYDQLSQPGRGQVATKEEAQVDIVMTAGAYRAKGRILMPDGKVAVNLQLLLYGLLDSGPKTNRFLRGPRVLSTDAHGSFDIGGIGKAIDGKQHLVFRLALILPRALTHQWGGTETPVQELCYLYASPSSVKSSVLDLGTLGLGDHVPLSFDLRDADENPAGASRVYVGEARKGEWLPINPMRFMSDRRGKLRILLPKREDLAILITNGIGFFISRLDIKKQASAMTIKLAVASHVEGRVLDKNGHPVEGAQVSVLEYQDKDPSRDPFLERFLHSVQSTSNAINRVRAVTDAEGRYRITFPSKRLNCRLNSRKRRGGKWRYVSETLLIQGEPVTDFNLILK